MRPWVRGPATRRPGAPRPGPEHLRFPPGQLGERSLMTLQTTGDRPRVIVVGAGFAGLYAVRGLKKSGYRVTVIDKNLYSTFQPLLYQVATGGLNPGDVSYAVGGYARQHHDSFVRGELAGIDAVARRAKLADGRELDY